MFHPVPTDREMLLTPGIVNQTLELNEMFHMCQTKHMSKIYMGFGPYKHGPRVKASLLLEHRKHTNSFHFKYRWQKQQGCT